MGQIFIFSILFLIFGFFALICFHLSFCYFRDEDILSKNNPIHGGILLIIGIALSVLTIYFFMNMYKAFEDCWEVKYSSKEYKIETKISKEDTTYIITKKK